MGAPQVEMLPDFQMQLLTDARSGGRGLRISDFSDGVMSIQIVYGVCLARSRYRLQGHSWDFATRVNLLANGSQSESAPRRWFVQHLLAKIFAWLDPEEKERLFWHSSLLDAWDIPKSTPCFLVSLSDPNTYARATSQEWNLFLEISWAATT